MLAAGQEASAQPWRQAAHDRGSAQPEPIQLYLVVQAIDMRLGIEGLSALVERTLGHTPCAGSAYAFSNKTRRRVKLLRWDATGVWLCARRLHTGRFIWPEEGSTTQSAQTTQTAQTVQSTQVAQMDQESWAWLVMGVDWRRLRASVEEQSHWRVG